MTENKLIQPETFIKQQGSKQQYHFLFTQANTDAPVPIVLYNNLGQLTFTRTGVGIYQITSNNLFVANKTIIEPFGGEFSSLRILTNPEGGSVTVWTTMKVIDENTIKVICVTSANGNVAREFSEAGGSFFAKIIVYK